MKTQCNTCNTLRNRGYKYGKNYCSKRVKGKWLNISLLFSTSFSPFFDTLRCGPHYVPRCFLYGQFFIRFLKSQKSPNSKLMIQIKAYFLFYLPSMIFQIKKALDSVCFNFPPFSFHSRTYLLIYACFFMNQTRRPSI